MGEGSHHALPALQVTGPFLALFDVSKFDKGIIHLIGPYTTIQKRGLGTGFGLPEKRNGCPAGTLH